MACRKCSAPCHGRFCQMHRIEAANEGTTETEGTKRTIEALRELDDDASHLKAKEAGD